jgi:hypothetical protein
MAIGILNPSDSSHTPSVRPTRTNTGVNQRRWFSNSMSTEVRDQDLNDILAQIRYAIDYYSVLDVEGDDSLLQQAIAIGASSLTGNLAQLQAIVGGANKVPYWISGSAMGTFTATSFSRSLFAMTNQTQWRDALGISAVESDNIIAFGGLTASANTLGYFTGPGTMGLTNLTSAARGLLDDADVTAMRATLLLGSAALHPDTDFATPSDLALKANLASPSFTGAPTAPTAATSTNSTQLATTAYVKANIAALTTADIGGFTAAMTLKADLASPALTGTPTAPTPSTATNSTQIATTAYVKSNLTSYAPLASPALTGTPTAPTAASGTNTTQLATTAFVGSAISTASGSYQPLSANLTTLSGSSAFFLTLSDDANASVARATLGLGTAATHADTDFVVPTDLIPYAPLASPALTGTPTAPTAATATNTTQIASTAYVKNNLASYAPLASPAFTGTATADALTVNNGSLIVDRVGDAASSLLILKADAGSSRIIQGYTGITARWAVALGNNTAESGSNVGANFAISRYDDTGVIIDIPLSIVRSTGIATFSVSPTAPTPTAGDNTTKLATTAFVKASYAPLASPVLTGTVTADALTVNNGTLLLDRTGDAAASIFQMRADSGFVRRIQSFTGTLTRWILDLGNSVAESGANAGSNFFLSRYDDSGALLDTPINIPRSTGIVAFASSPTGPTPSTADNTTKLATTAYVQSNLTPKAPLASPAFTGVPTAPTPTAGDNTTQLSTTAFVTSAISTASGSYQPLSANLTTLAASSAFFLTLSDDANAPTARTTLGLGTAATHAETDFVIPTDLAVYAPLASPALTGTPTAPTAANATNSTQIASTAFVQNNLAFYAPLASPALTGTPTAPTPTAGDNSTSLATTAFVSAYAPLASPVFTGTVTADFLVVNNGSITVDRTGDTTTAALNLRADAGQNRFIVGSTGTSNRWVLNIATNAAETGANAGSNLGIVRYDDAGTLIDTPLLITRSTGIVTFSQIPVGVTPTAGDNSTNLATTAFVSAYAPLASPALTGTPTAPTPTAGDNSTKLATTAFVSAYAPLASPVLTGTVTADALIVNNGSLTIDRVGDAVNPLLVMKSDTGMGRVILGQTGTSPRWAVTLGTNSAETGSNVGSNFAISRYDDSGTLIDNALLITRSTGIAAFSVSPTAPTPTAGDNTTKLATTAFVKASFAPLASPALTGTVTADALTVNNGTLIVDRTGDASLSVFQLKADSGSARRIQSLTGNLSRWIMDIGNVTAESGANAGTNFSLSRYDDAGVLIDSPITIIRSSGLITAATPMRMSAGTVTGPGLQVGNDGNSGFFSDTADTFAISINSTECGRFLSGPKLIFGGTAAVNVGATTVIPIIQVNGILTNNFSFGVSAFNASSGGAIFAGGKSRSGTTGVFGTAPIASDTLVEYRATADDTTTFVLAGSLRFLAKGDYSVVGTQNADFEVRVQSAGTLNTKFKVKAIGDLTDGSDNILIDSNRILRPRSYTVATLPAITVTGIIDVSDAFGGLGCQARSDGTSWRRVGDDAVLISATVSAYGTLSRMLGQPSYKLRKLIWNTQQKLIDAGLSAKLKGLWVHALPVQSDALINWITPGTRDMQIVGTPVFTANQGFTGDGTSALLNTVASFATFGAGQDDVAVGTYVLTASAASAAVIGRNTTTRTVYLNSFTSGALAARLNDSSADTFTPPRYTGLFTLSRTASTGFGAYLDDSLVATITRASTGNTGNITFLGTLDTAGSEFSTTKVAFSFISTGLTAADVKNLKRIMVDYFLMEVGAVSPSAINSPHPSSETYSVERWEIPASDMTGILTAAADRGARFAAYDFTVFDAFVGVTGAQSSSGVVTADVNKNGTSIFTTNPSIDALEYTSLTGTAGVLKTDGTQIFAKGDRISLDADASGTGASGLVATLIGYRTP